MYAILIPLGPWELTLIFLAVLLLFGAKRLPEIAKGLGKGITEFKQAMKQTTDEVKGSLDVDKNTNNSADSSEKKTE